MLEVNDLSVGHRGRAVIAKLSLFLNPGEIAVVLGRNGSGKSTLLRCLAGFTDPLHGSIEVEGVGADDRDARFRRLVSSLLDDGAWYPDLTALEHLRLIQRANHPLPDGWFSAGQLLEGFGIDHVGGATPGRLSSGERQRLALALTLARPSRLLLLDEPERHLDDAGRVALAAILRRYADGGRAAVVATHDDTVSEVATQLVAAEDFAA